jgi:16S rRNA processing protein RimM
VQKNKALMDDAVAIGRFGGPFGVKGWIKVISFTQPAEQILSYLPWFFFKGGRKQEIKEVNAQLHGKNLILQLEQSQDRESAKTFTNLEIYIDRSQLPALSNEEYYWIDLVGLAVINKEAVELGRITSVFATGSNDVIVVRAEDGKERYIPYLTDVVLEVNLDQKTVMVDWDADF